MAKKRVLILLKQNTGKTVDEVAVEIEKAGITVKNILPGPGIISGEARSQAAIKRVRDLAEVASVREDKSVSIQSGTARK